MTEHTQGPWTREDHERHGEHRCEIIGGGRHIATIHTAFGVWDTNEANANLTVAAPDLLAALEQCLATMAVVSPEGAIAVLGAHDAIAKARGEIMPGYYDCITCGPLDMEYHDARDAKRLRLHDVHSGMESAITSPDPPGKRTAIATGTG